MYTGVYLGVHDWQIMYLRSTSIQNLRPWIHIFQIKTSQRDRQSISRMLCWLSVLAILHWLWRYWFRRSRTLLSSLCTKGQSTWRKVQRNQFNLFWITHSTIIIISSRKNFFPLRDMDRVLNAWFFIRISWDYIIYKVQFIFYPRVIPLEIVEIHCISF